MISVLSPCLLPIVPTFGVIMGGASLVARGSGRDIDRGRGPRAMAYSAAFTLGFAGLFVLLGASGTGAGWWFRGVLPALQSIGGVVVLLVGVWIVAATGGGGLPTGWRRIGLPAGLFLIGVGVSAAWTPCIGPVLATILLAAGSAGGSSTGILLLTVYAAGLSVPFILVGNLVGWLSRRMTVGGSVARFGRGVVGGLFFIVAILMLSGRFAWLSATLSRYGPFIELSL